MGLKNVLYRLCYRLGFYPIKIKSPQVFYAYLKRQPQLLKEFELNQLSYAIALGRDHKYYNSLLHKFIPQWLPAQIDSAKFVGEGYGGGSLNAYRHVQIKGEDLFEKVYFNNLIDFKKTTWFQENIAELIHEEISFPKIKKIYSGELISIAYFDYLTLDRVKHASSEELIAISKILYTLSEKHSARLTKMEKPARITNFGYHPQYEKYRESASQKLHEKALDSQQFEKLASASKHVLTHGDLQKTNAYKKRILLDWDAFGFYPVGLEPAFLFFRRVFKEGEKENPSTWLYKNYQAEIKEKDWKDFERNFIYFLFVFSMELFLIEQKEKLEEILLKKMRNYF